MNKFGHKTKGPECTCGSNQCGLIFISDENRYQCGDCIRKVYADLAENSKITLDPLDSDLKSSNPQIQERINDGRIVLCRKAVAKMGEKCYGEGITNLAVIPEMVKWIQRRANEHEPGCDTRLLNVEARGPCDCYAEEAQALLKKSKHI